jgi:hypothetical protein
LILLTLTPMKERVALDDGFVVGYGESDVDYIIVGAV